jgi:hypothetical protein
LYDRIYFIGNRSNQIEKRAAIKLMALHRV